MKSCKWKRNAGAYWETGCGWYMASDNRKTISYIKKGICQCGKKITYGRSEGK